MHLTIDWLIIFWYNQNRYDQLHLPQQSKNLSLQLKLHGVDLARAGLRGRSISKNQHAHA